MHQIGLTNINFRKLLIASLFASTLGVIAYAAAPLTRISFEDVNLYSFYSNLISHGMVPYRDFQLEYPPGAVIAIFLGGVSKYLNISYQFGFIFLVILALIYPLYDQFNQHSWQRLAVVLLLLLPVLQFIFFRLDVFAALAIYISITLLIRKKYQLSAVALAISIAIKGYPLLLLPIIFLVLEKGKRLRYLIVTGCTLLLIGLFFFIASPSGIWHSFTYHSQRPAEIYSAPAAIGFVAKLLGADVHQFMTHGSHALSFSHDKAVILLLGLIFAAGLTFICLLVKKSYIATCCLVVMLMFIAAFKIGSMQFIVPAILLGFLAFDEIGKLKKQLAVRLFLIGIIFYAAYINFEAVINLEWQGGLLVVLKTLVVAESVIWLCRVLYGKNKNLAQSRIRHFQIFTNKLFRIV